MVNHVKYVYYFQILFLTAVICGSQKITFDNAEIWVSAIARYVFYILIIWGLQEGFDFAIKKIKGKPVHDTLDVIMKNKKCLSIAAASAAIVFFYGQPIFTLELLSLYMAYLITNFTDMEKKAIQINYGTGMASSFFEGYLVHIIPNDGAKFVGFEENIRAYEDSQTVKFPVKRLFIVITKNLFCPPDLKQFNKTNRPDLPYLEACQRGADRESTLESYIPLEDIEKDVAGVKNRIYRNSAYKIHRPGKKKQIYLAVECSTPLHTLYRVLNNKYICDELSGINVAEVVDDFCTMLRKIIAKSPETRDKCELVYYDNEDSDQNLASILLETMMKLNPHFDYDT